MRTATSALVVALLLFCATPASAYSVLTHEAVIDATWDASIAPVLRARFHPTADALRRARAYAYGGSLIQDIGYYPLAGTMFGNLTHYVRSGDFVMALITESRTLDEEAFALGALAHYAADVEGHPLAVNVSVARMYPKLEAKYGDHVTYEDDPAAHLRTEFSFDVVEVMRGAYAPQSYRDFIGFEVSQPVLARAFTRTYGLNIEDAFPNVDLAIGTFRRAVSTIIPAMTKVAWDLKEKDLKKSAGLKGARQDAVFTMSRREYEQRWGTAYQHPGIMHKIVAWSIRFLPKVGPFKALAFKAPTPDVQQLFVRSLDTTLRRYRSLVAEVADHHLSLANVNFDTGRPVAAGDYRLVDETYAGWVDKLADGKFAALDPTMRRQILAFFRDPERPLAGKHDAHTKLLHELDELRQTRVTRAD